MAFRSDWVNHAKVGAEFSSVVVNDAVLVDSDPTRVEPSRVSNSKVPVNDFLLGIRFKRAVRWVPFKLMVFDPLEPVSPVTVTTVVPPSLIR